MRLVGKFTLALMLGMCLVLGVYGYFSVRRERAFFEEDIQRDERLIGQALSKSVAEVWRREGEAQALALIQDTSEIEDGVDVRWVWPNAPRGDAFEPRADRDVLKGLEVGKGITRFERGPGAGRLYTYIAVPIDGGRVGALELSESLDEHEGYVRGTAKNAALTVLVLLGISGALAMVLGTWIVGRPVRSLMAKARRIGVGDLGAPLVLRQKDELAELAVEMNMMCERLADARTSLTEASAARVAALEQLRHADRLMTVGKLASGIAHELGTPLNVVSGRAKMIERGLPATEIVENAAIIGVQAARMAAIIRQLLDFARSGTPQKAPGDLSEHARQTLSLLQPLAQKRRVSLSFEQIGEARLVPIDAAQLQQVLTNLVMNGIQSMKDGGELTVRLGVVRARPPEDHSGAEGEHLELRVADQGEGISPEDLPHVFEPFFTTKDVGEGTGLGLSVTHGIVREHGGWIEVDSRVDLGSTFSVYLPLGAGE